MINYKNTLNLPKKIGFPMQGNMLLSEKNILYLWYKEDIYKIIRKEKKGNKKFILHDGPPYANGDIHLGHAVNKILKDIIIKSKGLNGYDVHYIPGWDCHGLPIELNVEQIYGNLLYKISKSYFNLASRCYAVEQIIKQKKDFIRLGVIGDWNNPYLTMDYKIESNIIKSLSHLISLGYLYKGLKPVYWCNDCKSTLSESESIYFNIKSNSIYVLFLFINSLLILKQINLNLFYKKIYIIIWTTTPWTLPANKGIIIHPDLYYQLIELNDGTLIMLAKNVVEKFMLNIKKNYWIILGNIIGYKLKGLLLKHPFMNNVIKILLSKFINIDLGTGAVHMAPGHGPEDYLVSLKYNINIKNIINNKGRVSLCMPVLNGLEILKSNKIIIRILKNVDSLLYIKKIMHKFPHCWRHKKPLYYRATKQFFIKINKNMKKKSKIEINKVIWKPIWCKENIYNMVLNRPDWCISRQRTWGVPIPLFINKTTGLLHSRTIEYMEKIANLVLNKGSQIWCKIETKDILGNEESNKYKKILDILDVWFESGTTNYSVFIDRNELIGKKSDIYIEGSDQHRGWFISSLIFSIYLKNTAPYRKVLTHGFTVDKYGKKMSKSLGNVLCLEKIIKKLGADILRLWVSSIDYTRSEIFIYSEIWESFKNIYRRIRNTLKFLFNNIYDFNYNKDLITYDKLIILDIWAVNITKKIQNKIILFYDKYEFHNVVQYIIKFCSIYMGSFYFEIIKDRLYTMPKYSIGRRSCQTVLYHILQALVRWISPILSFTSEEIWRLIPGNHKTIFTEQWYKGLFLFKRNEIMNDKFWKIILLLRNEINKIIEENRLNKFIGSSLESNIIIYVSPNLFKKILLLENELHFIFLISKIKVKKNLKTSNIKIILIKSQGIKCLRCWHIIELNNYIINYGNLCNKCVFNLIKILGGKRLYV